MSITRLFAVYDEKSELFGTPIFLRTVSMAIRSFQDQADDHNSVIGRHPTDFHLYEIGTYDDNTGDITSSEPNIHHGSALSHIRQSTLDIDENELDVTTGVI